jgi:membrane protease YdiL (CAAX protease family)
MRPICLWQEE